jgi:hypothetical protein
MIYDNPFSNLIGLEIVPYFIIGALAVYFFIILPILLIKRKALLSFYPENIVYYESKILGYAVVFLITLIFGVLSLLSLFQTTLSEFKDVFYLFESISLVALIFTSLYSSAMIAIKNDGFFFKKGSFELSSSWSEIKGIHFNPAPSIWAGVFHDFKSVSFIIETNKDVTKYIDGATLKIRGKYSLLASKGEELLGIVSEKSGITPTTGTYSELSDSKHKTKTWIFLIILLVVIAISFWYSTRV